MLAFVRKQTREASRNWIQKWNNYSPDNSIDQLITKRKAKIEQKSL